MFNNIGKSGAIAFSLAAVFIVGAIFVFLVFTDPGKKITDSLILKKDAGVTNNISGNVYEGDVYIGNKDRAEERLRTRSLQKHDKLVDTMINERIKLEEELEYYKDKGLVTIDIYQSFGHKLDAFKADTEKQRKITIILGNSDKVIRVGIENVSKIQPFNNSIKYKKEFFLAKLKELKNELSDDFLSDISKRESKKIFAQLIMIKSISHYIDYEPAKAFYYYEQAKKEFPSLSIITELEQEYKDIAPEGNKELRYTYISLASVLKSKENMEKTADEILSPTKAFKIRGLGNNLYLSVDYEAIKVYTIVEYREELEKISKFTNIKNVEKTAFEYDDTFKLPKEYRFRENRKKIYVYNSSGRNGDKNLVKRLKKRNIKHIEAKGKWKGRGFTVYAIYYDGNSCDKNDLDNFLEETKKIIGSYAVREYSYQQSKSKTIKGLFKDEYLKYVLVLEKNAYIRNMD